MAQNSEIWRISESIQLWNVLDYYPSDLMQIVGKCWKHSTQVSRFRQSLIELELLSWVGPENQKHKARSMLFHCGGRILKAKERPRNTQVAKELAEVLPEF